MFVSIPYNTDIILYMKRLPAPPQFKHCMSQAGWRLCFNTWVQQKRMVRKYLWMWIYCPEISVKFQWDLILGRIMMIKQKLNADRNRNMCYSGEWCKGYGIEPVFQNPLNCRTCLVMKNSDQILHGDKMKRQIKARNVIPACKITDWT